MTKPMHSLIGSIFVKTRTDATTNDNAVDNSLFIGVPYRGKSVLTSSDCPLRSLGDPLLAQESPPQSLGSPNRESNHPDTATTKKE